MSLFDEMIKNEEYKKLFEILPDDEKPILLNSIKNFVDDFEKALKNIEKIINVNQKNDNL